MLRIRRASEEDIDALVPLKASVHAMHVVARPDFFKAMETREVAAWLRERFAAESTRVWMAEDEGKTLGYVLVTRREREETRFSVARRWWEIEEIGVDENHRRRGIARALLQEVVAHAGGDTIELSSWAFNETAQAAFAHLGFQRMYARYELKGR